MDAHSFVPEVVRIHDRQKPWCEWLSGAVLFCDITGFTPLTEAFSAFGPEGSESLSLIINRYFAEMIGIVRGYGGEVMKFGGDSMLCFVPGSDAVRRGIAAALQMRGSMARFKNLRAPGRRITLQAKVGIAAGDVLVAGLGDPETRCDFLFAGDPVDLAAQAERIAASGEIVCAADPKHLSTFEVEHCSAQFYRVTGGSFSAAPAASLSSTTGEVERIRCYLIPDVYEVIASGYEQHLGALQNVVPAFLKFDGFSYSRKSFDLVRFDAFFREVVSCAAQCDGTLNGVATGDKGSNFYFLFGAPAQTEEKERLACEWALEVRDRLGRNFPEMAISIGMAGGRVFSGIVGGADRFDYSVVGDAVNLAARLASLAHTGEIWVDQQIRERAGNAFIFGAAETRRVKGKTSLVTCSTLRDRASLRIDPDFGADCIGRTKETRTLQNAIQDAAAGHPQMMTLEGEGGVGKSHLAYHALALARDAGLRTINGRSEITLRNRSYSPWREIIKTLLFDSAPLSKEGESSFTLDTLRETLQSVSPEFVPYLSWHAELLGLACAEEAPAGDEETRRSLFHHQLSRMLLARIQTPTVIFLDDLHWFDSLSLELIAALLNHAREEPLLLLATARPEWQKKS